MDTANFERIAEKLHRDGSGGCCFMGLRSSLYCCTNEGEIVEALRQAYNAGHASGVEVARIEALKLIVHAAGGRVVVSSYDLFHASSCDVIETYVPEQDERIFTTTKSEVER